MAAKIFIDGEAGTTGLQIRDRLSGRQDLELIAIPSAQRKEISARAEALNAADVVILCLPDDAARESVGLITNERTRVIDASTAHRIASGWTYGFPELIAGQSQQISTSMRVSNPGCWPTGFLALVRPLIDSGVLPSDRRLTVHGVSGYTGGGKSMIAQFEAPNAPDHTQTAYRAYATHLGHKHVPEMQTHAGLMHPPLFAPAVGRFAQGMIVEVPLFLSDLPGRPRVKDIQSVLARAYESSRFVSVATEAESLAANQIDAEVLAGSNAMKLYAFGDDVRGQARLVAQLDNLGKGASGAAVQNLNIMLGFDEGAGL